MKCPYCTRTYKTRQNCERHSVAVHFKPLPAAPQEEEEEVFFLLPPAPPAAPAARQVAAAVSLFPIVELAPPVAPQARQVEEEKVSFLLPPAPHVAPAARHVAVDVSPPSLLAPQARGEKAKEEEDWFFQQISASIETRASVRAMLGSAFFERLRNGKRFSDLPVDLLSIIFSFLRRKDIFAFIQVNRACLQVLQKQHAWRRHVHQRLVEELPDTMEKHRSLLPLFDAFGGLEPEPLEDQVGWIFNKPKSKYVILMHERQVGKHACFVIKRTKAKSMYVVNISIADKCVVYIDQQDTSLPFIIKRSEVYALKDSAIRYLKMENNLIVFAKSYVSEVKATWEGSCKSDSSTVIPDGDGKWTFDDGIVLEGKGVAKDAQPVFKLSEEEWREFKRIKTSPSQ